MKKFTILSTFLLFTMFCFTNIVSAQNLATNGGFENWNTNGAPGPPDDWTLSGSSITGSQETTTVRTGTYSTNLTWTTTSTIYLQQFIPVTAGNNYEFSFWVYDNDAGGKARVAIRWYDAGGSFISGFYGDYSTDDPNWQQLTSGSQTADAGAVEAHIEVRVYDISGWPGTATVYVDDADFSAVTTVEISKAYAINATSLDVIYSADVTTVNAGDYSLTGTAAITFSGATIDGADAKIVHLTGASVNMTGDNTVDNIADAANTTDFDFYAGIMPISYTNTTNPSGFIDGTHLASFIGVISANDAYNNVWMSDAAGERNGVLIYDYDFDGLVDVGDEIHFLAVRDVYDGLTELVTPELISVISTGNSPYGPTIIDGSDIDETIAADTDPGEKWEGQLVTIEDFTVDSYTEYDYVCSWSNGGTTYHFHIGDNVDYQFNNISLNVGEIYAEITGVIDWYNPDYYRINPREQSDIVEGVQVPIADFVADETIILVGGVINFTDLSVGTIDSWSWTFDGGTPGTSNQQNPTGIVYDVAGTYTVSLTVENEAGSNTNTKIDYISVGEVPDAEFEADNVNILEGESVNFTDLSLGDPDTWEWTFEGGTPETSSSQNPTLIQYNTFGSYDVTLNVSNMFGVSSLTKTDYINVEPVGITEGDARQFNIYPNPNNGKFFVEFKNNSEKEIKIYSLVGELIYNKSVNKIVSEINLSHLNNGIYFIKVYNENSKLLTAKKLVLQ